MVLPPSYTAEQKDICVLASNKISDMYKRLSDSVHTLVAVSIVFVNDDALGANGIAPVKVYSGGNRVEGGEAHGSFREYFEGVLCGGLGSSAYCSARFLVIY